MDERRGDVGRSVDRNSWRLDALDVWRKDLDRRLAVLESRVESERQARILRDALQERDISDAVAAAVSRAVGQKLAANQLPLWQKLGGLVAGALILADSVQGLIH